MTKDDAAIVGASPERDGWAPMSAVERAMARRMTIASEIPVATEYVQADIDAALSKLEVARRGGSPATFTALILASVARTLPDHPLLASTVDLERFRRFVPETFDVGIAVAAPRGLVVPVVRDVASMSFERMAEELADVVGRARAGDRDQELFRGGSLTITNIGGIGVEGGVPIPNPPQVAILGVGSAKAVPVLTEGTLGESMRVTLTIAIDHRALDGITAARFLVDVKDQLEQTPFL